VMGVSSRTSTMSASIAKRTPSISRFTAEDTEGKEVSEDERLNATGKISAAAGEVIVEINDFPDSPRSLRPPR
jgi:hypothetical protein